MRIGTWMTLRRHQHQHVKILTAIAPRKLLQAIAQPMKPNSSPKLAPKPDRYIPTAIGNPMSRVLADRMPSTMPTIASSHGPIRNPLNQRTTMKIGALRMMRILLMKAISSPSGGDSSLLARLQLPPFVNAAVREIVALLVPSWQLAAKP